MPKHPAAPAAPDRDTPTRSTSAGSARKRTPRPPLAGVVSLSELQPEPIRWISPGRLGIGKVTALDGAPGLGKSTLLCEFAARITRGQPLPGGQPAPAAPNPSSSARNPAATAAGPGSFPSPLNRAPCALGSPVDQRTPAWSERLLELLGEFERLP